MVSAAHVRLLFQLDRLLNLHVALPSMGYRWQDRELVVPRCTPGYEALQISYIIYIL